MSCRRPSFLAAALLSAAVLLQLLVPSCGQSSSSGSSSSTSSSSSSSSSSTGGASVYPYSVTPIARLSYYGGSYQPVAPQYVTFDAIGRLTVVYKWASNLAVAYSVDANNRLTQAGMYPWADGFSGSWGQAVVYQTQSGPQPVTVVLGGDSRIVEFSAVTSNLTQWIAINGSSTYYSTATTLSYPGLGSSGWSYTAVALDQRLGLFYAAVNPCNAVFQFAISATSSQTYFTQQLAFNGSNPSLNQPIGLAVDSSSLLYVADRSNRVVQFNSLGQQLAVLIDSGSGFFSYPQFIVDPSSGDFLVVNPPQNLIRRWKRDGTQNTTFLLPSPRGLSSLAVNQRGDFFILDSSNWSVVVVPAAQAAPATWSNGNGGTAVQDCSEILFVSLVVTTLVALF